MLSPEGLRQRSCLLQAIRSFFLGREYLEVDTPVRLPVLIPEAHIQPFESEDWLLQTSPEMCMKMLLAGGATQLFQICHCFRKEESGRLHQTEFSMLEWYHVGWDYFALMEECEALFGFLVEQLADFPGVKGQEAIVYRGKDISFTAPWARLTLEEAFEAYSDITLTQAQQTDCFEEVLVEQVEPHLGWDTPVFVYDYPIEMASLARPKADDPKVAERFELYVGGVELANGFSELVDPLVQQKRFVQERNIILQQGRSIELPEQFIDSLKQLGETAGIALGIDRLAMLLLGKEKLTQILPVDVRFL